MKSLLKILIAGGVSWYLTDLESGFFLTDKVMPAVFGFSILCLLIWVNNRVHSDRISSAATPNGGAPPGTRFDDVGGGNGY